MNLLFLSGNAICWVTPHRPSHDGRPERIMFRGGPYGGAMTTRGRGRRSMVPSRSTDRTKACSSEREHRARQRRRRLGRARARALGLQDASSAAISFPDWSAGSTTATRPRSRASRSSPGARPGWVGRRRRTGPRRSIQARRGISCSTPRQSSGRGFVLATGAHAPVVALVTPPRTRCASPEDDRQPARMRALGRRLDGNPVP